MTIYDLMIVFIIGLIIYSIWQHNNMSLIARAAAKQHCEMEGVQFLDHNVILTMMSPCRSEKSLVALKRQYRFEFSTVGDMRYNGVIILKGPHVSYLELEPYKVNESDHSIH